MSQVRDEVVSPSLLHAVDWKKPVSIQFNLGMSEFVEDGAFRSGKGKENKPLSLKKSRRARDSSTSMYPSSKRPRCVLEPIPADGLEAAATAHSSNGRFSFQSKEKYAEMSTSFVPDNTKKTNEWAYSNFVVWCEHRNVSCPDEPCPTDLIESPP